MVEGSESLEENIVEEFRNSLKSSDNISEDVSTVISDLCNEDDFGGREQIQEQVLNAVSEDEN